MGTFFVESVERFVLILWVQTCFGVAKMIKFWLILSKIMNLYIMWRVKIIENTIKTTYVEWYQNNTWKIRYVFISKYYLILNILLNIMLIIRIQNKVNDALHNYIATRQPLGHWSIFQYFSYLIVIYFETDIMICQRHYIFSW